MALIIGALILQAVAGAFIFGGMRAAEPAPMIGLGIVLLLGSAVMLLYGLRKFLLSEVMTVLERLIGPRFTNAAWKKCIACTAMVPGDAKICRWCGREEFHK